LAGDNSPERTSASTLRVTLCVCETVVSHLDHAHDVVARWSSARTVRPLSRSIPKMVATETRTETVALPSRC
jgi:hypothetical protein